MELAWAVATIVFRFILVRFADRGLVNGGVVSKLFGYLYICFGGCFSLLTYSMILASHTKQIEMTNLCLLNYSNEYHMSWNKNLKIGTAFTTAGLILLWMLYLRCKFFVATKSKDGTTPPAIFGRFQRNVLTFEETICYHTLMTVSGFVTPLLNFYVSDLIFAQISFLCTFLTSFLLQLYILVRSVSRPILHKSDTSSVSKSQLFYVRKPQIVPRRDFRITNVYCHRSKINAHPVTPIPTNIIHVKPVNNT